MFSLSNLVTGLSTVSAVVSQVETTAAAAPAPVTGAQKLQAAVLLISAINPAIGVDVAALELVISAAVSMFNLFGIFQHK